MTQSWDFLAGVAVAFGYHVTSLASIIIQYVHSNNNLHIQLIRYGKTVIFFKKKLEYSLQVPIKRAFILEWNKPST